MQEEEGSGASLQESIMALKLREELYNIKRMFGRCEEKHWEE